MITNEPITEDEEYEHLQVISPLDTFQMILFFDILYSFVNMYIQSVQIKRS